MTNKKTSTTIKYFLLILGVFSILYPFYLIILTSLKTTKESSRNFFALPSALYLDNFKQVVEHNNFFVYSANSIIITIASIILILIIIPPAAYSIGRNINKKYFKFLYVIFIMGIITPFQVIMLPITKFMMQLGLQNRLGLIILYITYASSQGIFLYVGYIRTSLPSELEEAAKIDGCTNFKTYLHIIFPLLQPITGTVIILDSFWIWNDFLLPLLMLNRSQLYWTLPLFQYNFKSQYTFDYNLAFATFVLSIIPIMCVYGVFQKKIMAGFLGGAIKG